MFQVQTYAGADGSILRYGLLTQSNQAAPGGRALLYVPGLGGSVKGALDFLSALLPGFNPIYGPDLRGFGLNLNDNPLASIDIILKDLEAFHRQVLAPAGHSELTLCGISLGASLATLMAVAHPERYAQLILLAPSFKPHPKSFSLGYTIRNTLAYFIKGKHARTTLPYDVKNLTRNQAVLTDPQYTESPKLLLSPGFLLGARGLGRRAYKQMSRLVVPTLMVIPGQDTVCDPAAMREGFARIPAATPKRCLEYPDFYHDVLMEEGASGLIAQEVLGGEWLSAASCAASSSLR